LQNVAIEQRYVGGLSIARLRQHFNAFQWIRGRLHYLWRERERENTVRQCPSCQCVTDARSSSQQQTQPQFTLPWQSFPPILHTPCDDSCLSQRRSLLLLLWLLLME
jgi:hypothetical protein